ncbi:MAG: type II secretion system F family protein [Coriobacteriales bacterium]|jgi:tight adherence protein B|nr:type II secretion system F family protein [Coriobacteriales bacterium]
MKLAVFLPNLPSLPSLPSVFAWLAVFLAMVSGALALPMMIESINSLRRRVLRKQRAIDDEAKSSLIKDIIRNGLPLLRIPASMLLKIKPFSTTCTQVLKFLDTELFASSLDKVAELMLAACLLAGLIGWIVTNQLLIALAFAISVPVIIKSYIVDKTSKRNQQMREQLPDALLCLGFCFMAGCSLPQAIEQTASETPQPLKRELVRISDDLTSGLGVKESLQAFEARNSLPELSFMAVALEIQHQTGGSLKDILESAATSVRTAVNLKKQLHVHTAQARLSFKVVAFMPLFLVVVLSVTMQGYLETFFSTTTGFMLLLIAVAMELTGIILIRRILGVDLG